MSYCQPFCTYQIVMPGGAVPESDRFGRWFIRAGNGTVYLVPFSAYSEKPAVRWLCHERHRIAVPCDEPSMALRHFAEQDPNGYSEGRSDILLVNAEHLACAELLALAANARIHGWGTGTHHDCSGRSFASPADRFVFRKWDNPEPGSRSKDRTYGFMICSAIDC